MPTPSKVKKKHAKGFFLGAVGLCGGWLLAACKVQKGASHGKGGRRFLFFTFWSATGLLTARKTERRPFEGKETLFF